jgi:transcriptional regulator with XRE-family HTH domain
MERGELRRARLATGLTVEQVAARTCISSALIRRIEADDFSGLPGGLYARSLIRTYAQTVGIDPNRALRELIDELPDAATPVVPPEPPPRDADNCKRVEGVRRLLQQQTRRGSRTASDLRLTFDDGEAVQYLPPVPRVSVASRMQRLLHAGTESLASSLGFTRPKKV